MTERLEEILNDLPSSIRHSGELESLKKYAREQVERARELEETNKKNYWIAADFKFENLQLEQQNKRYREALEFYADEENYEPSEVQIGAVTKEGYKISKYKYDPIINTDKGKKARETLGWEENK